MATTEKNKTAGKNSTELTVHEIRVLAKSWKAMKAMPEIDISKLAEECGMKNEKSAANIWGRIRKKLFPGSVQSAAAGGAAAPGGVSATPPTTPTRKRKNSPAVIAPAPDPAAAAAALVGLAAGTGTAVGDDATAAAAAVAAGPAADNGFDGNNDGAMDTNGPAGAAAPAVAPGSDAAAAIVGAPAGTPGIIATSVCVADVTKALAADAARASVHPRRRRGRGARWVHRKPEGPNPPAPPSAPPSVPKAPPYIHPRRAAKSDVIVLKDSDDSDGAAAVGAADPGAAAAAAKMGGTATHGNGRVVDNDMGYTDAMMGIAAAAARLVSDGDAVAPVNGTSMVYKAAEEGEDDGTI